MGYCFNWCKLWRIRAVYFHSICSVIASILLHKEGEFPPTRTVQLCDKSCFTSYPLCLTGATHAPCLIFLFMIMVRL